MLSASFLKTSYATIFFAFTLWLKNAPTLADYNYDPVQSILIIFSKLFVNVADDEDRVVERRDPVEHIRQLSEEG